MKRIALSFAICVTNHSKQKFYWKNTRNTSILLEKSFAAKTVMPNSRGIRIFNGIWEMCIIFIRKWKIMEKKRKDWFSCAKNAMLAMHIKKAWMITSIENIQAPHKNSNARNVKKALIRRKISTAIWKPMNEWRYL